MRDKETSHDIVAGKLTFNDSASAELPLICQTLSKEDEYFRAHQVCLNKYCYSADQMLSNKFVKFLHDF